MAMQWSFSNKSSHLLSFNEDNKPKTGFEALKSTGLVTITTEAFDSTNKSYVMQKSKVPEKQEGVRYSVSSHPTKHIDRHTIHRSIANQMKVAVSAKQSFIGQNRIGSVSPQPISTLPPANTSSHTVGTTEARSGPKISNPDLLTIFYNGSVCVFDNVSPEKAQAIMLLAGNGPPSTPSTSSPIAPAQPSAPRSSILDGFSLGQPYNGSPCLSPVPIKSIKTSHTASLPNNNRITTTSGMHPVRILESSMKPEPLRAVYPTRPVPQTPPPSGTVPQFRRKSLARFLEKRKDRVISVSPYAEKQSSDSISFGQLR